MLKQIAMLVDGQGVGVVIVDSPIVAAPGIPALREMRMG
jgi:hypothetical protein